VTIIANTATTATGNVQFKYTATAYGMEIQPTMTLKRASLPSDDNDHSYFIELTFVDGITAGLGSGLLDLDSYPH